jgi:hypothetical protein
MVITVGSICLYRALDARAYVARGGYWLGRVRDWIQRKKRNGDRVTWGSGEVLDPPMTEKEVEEVVEEAVESCYQDLVFNPKGWSTWYRMLPAEIREAISYFFLVREASFDLMKGTIIVVFEDIAKTYCPDTNDVRDVKWVLRVLWEKNSDGFWDVVYANHII